MNTFGIPIIPENEEERLTQLHKYLNSDTYSEGTFKHVAAMAFHIFNVPIALVTFVDKEKVSLKANIGMEDKTEIDRGVSLCSLVVLKGEVTVFENATEAPCLLANPFVAGNFGLQFYAGAPLKTADGFNLGAVCILDKTPREFSVADQHLLKSLAAVVMDEMEEKKVCN